MRMWSKFTYIVESIAEAFFYFISFAAITIIGTFVLGLSVIWITGEWYLIPFPCGG
jgi:hypothetical protein